MCSYARTIAESVGYCVAIIITFFIHILEHTTQTRFKLTDFESHHTGAVLQVMNLGPRYNKWIMHYDTNFFFLSFFFFFFFFLNFVNAYFCSNRTR